VPMPAKTSEERDDENWLCHSCISSDKRVSKRAVNCPKTVLKEPRSDPTSVADMSCQSASKHLSL
jgi:hypothetical protein